MIAQFSRANHPSAMELEHAIKLSKAVTAAGWKPPEISN
jgi:hypothetical protein